MNRKNSKNPYRINDCADVKDSAPFINPNPLNVADSIDDMGGSLGFNPKNPKKTDIDSTEPYKPTTVTVNTYKDLIKSGRPNKIVKGFNFDVDTFENLCDAWTPKKMFPVILNCSISELNKFCNIVYNMDFDHAYDTLIGITDLWSRRAFKNLAFNGNPTALKVVAENFMKLSPTSDNSDTHITIVNDLSDLS